MNVDIFSEGFDCPDLEFVQLARPTRSLVKYIQQVGRGLRRNGEKQCIILDNVGMYVRFGLPDDDRPWKEYFEGIKKFPEKAPRFTDNDDGRIENWHPHERDLTEGIDEMKLIQQVDIKPNSEVINSTPEDAPSENMEKSIEVRSTLVYSKYNIIGSVDGYYLENVKTQERQFLTNLSGRRSISIKLMKSDKHRKGYMIISSFNTNSKPTLSDLIIGYLFREGRIIRFESLEEKIVTVKV